MAFILHTYSVCISKRVTLNRFQTWVRIASSLITPRRQSIPESSSGSATTESVVTKEPRPAKLLLPGPSHLTTLLHTFPQLFEHVKKRIAVDEVKYSGVLAIIKVSFVFLYSPSLYYFTFATLLRLFCAKKIS